MPLEQQGIIRPSSNIDKQTQQQICGLFRLIDRKIAELTRVRGLRPSQVKLLEPVQVCVFVQDSNIFVALTAHVPGGIALERFIDWSGKLLNLKTAIMLVERDLGFRDAFGFQFSRAVLAYDDNEKEAAVAQIAESYIDEEVANVERQERVVRLNPIFSGRDFLVNEQLVFVLSPFEEPFDTIYKDHIKSTVESVSGLGCLRADDIYDNRPIIEDIWRYTNEARMLIAELTGRNPNVFYETGIAHTVGKEVILITQSMDDVPFDLKHLRCVVYEYTPRGMATLEQNLNNTILNVLARRG